METAQPISRTYSKIHWNRVILLVSSTILFLLVSAGFACFFALGYVREGNHFKESNCMFDNCNSTATVCGTVCDDNCATIICVNSIMDLYLVSDKTRKRGNYTVETDLYVCNLDVLNNPYSCDRLLGGTTITCYYDDRNVEGTLRLYDGYYVPGAYSAGVILLPVALFFSFVFFIWSVLYCFCRCTY